jgi:hypothetical protein
VHRRPADRTTDTAAPGVVALVGDDMARLGTATAER